MLNREEFDAIEFDAASTGEHEAAAERMLMLARSGTESLSLARAEAFVRAGEQWLLADNALEAARSFRLAIADGGPVEIDPRVPLCRALFQLGQPEEAYALLGRVKEEGRTDPRTCDMVMEALVEQSDLRGALEWADAGVEYVLRNAPGGSGGDVPDPREDSGSGLRDLLRLRYRIRNDLRLPEDDYDRMLSD